MTCRDFEGGCQVFTCWQYINFYKAYYFSVYTNKQSRDKQASKDIKS